MTRQIYVYLFFSMEFKVYLPEEHILEEPLGSADLDLPVPVQPEELQLGSHHLGDLVAVGSSASAAANLKCGKVSHESVFVTLLKTY